jgi:2-polyprenyl-3-methyl-5-hydroxy-6-metoxy-1,4-benzoquinol methylase
LQTQLDGVAHKHIPETRSVLERARRKGQKLLYYLIAGYRVTGERVHPLFADDNFVNHLRVYQYVRQFVANREVLDVGCGVGYGASLLSRFANRVVGIDISLAAIKEAYRFYPECEFFQMDAEDLKFPNESFDVVISTENFEHLANQAKHVAEIARVIRKDGFAFIATPNPELSVGSNNPFHIKENTFSELRELLSSRFRQVEIVEPFHLPQHQDGRAAQEERFSKGERGKVGGPGLEIFGKQVDTRFLSNSHSFHCFVREPIE